MLELIAWMVLVFGGMTALSTVKVTWQRVIVAVAVVGFATALFVQGQEIRRLSSANPALTALGPAGPQSDYTASETWRAVVEEMNAESAKRR